MTAPNKENDMLVRPRRTALALAAALPAAVLAAAPPAQAAPPTFSGVCTITGTVIPFTDFDGDGNCTGTLGGEVITNLPVHAVATATGTSIGPLPFLQKGSGSLTFPSKGVTIDFTFDQTLTTLVLKGGNTGVALGEVVPLETSGATRKAQVIATTVTPLG